MAYRMASSPSAGSSNFWLVILYMRFPRRCLMMLKVIFLPSDPPEAVRSTAWVARLWKVVMLRIMATDCSGMNHRPSMTIQLKLLRRPAGAGGSAEQQSHRLQQGHRGTGRDRCQARLHSLPNGQMSPSSRTRRVSGAKVVQVVTLSS